MSENPINITALNDFVFCPMSIYFHMLYIDIETKTYYSTNQTSGLFAHKTIDENKYPVTDTVTGLDVYCEKYNLIGKIDVYNKKTKTLIERKKKVKTLYDGYIFQLYAQYFSMVEMGYEVDNLLIHSLDDNKNYSIKLPSEDVEMFKKFEFTISEINSFDMKGFVQSNYKKCSNCIYVPYCDRGCGFAVT